MLTNFLFVILTYCVLLCFIALAKITPSEKIGNLIWGGIIVIFLFKCSIELFVENEKKIYLDAYTEVLTNKERSKNCSKSKYSSKRKQMNLVKAKKHTRKKVEVSTKKKLTKK